MPHARRRAATGGFTLSELLLVLTIALLITLVAYPTLSTFQGANKDASAATRLVRVYNKVIDQARRRNRAHVVELSLFLADQPGGRIDISESRSTSCGETATRVDDDAFVRLIESQPFGGTVIGTYIGPVEPTAGLRGWSTGEDDEQREPLRICIAPDGSASRLLGAGLRPMAGVTEVLVQRFQIDRGGWGRVGAPRRVELTFAGGARMRVN